MNGASRESVCRDYGKLVCDSEEMLEQLSELDGRRLACHCRLDQECHADILIEIFDDYRSALIQELAASPVSGEQALAEAERQRQLVGERARSKKLEGRMAPTRILGCGPPLLVKRGPHQRLFCDGAGLCSPGLWPPEMRYHYQGPAEEIRVSIRKALGLLD